MIWLELRTHNTRYSYGWNFTESVWAPTHKENGSRWPFWGLVNNIIKGDIIFHLKHENDNKHFLGYSIAASDGYKTYELPTPDRHDWDFSRTYYKADLSNFQPIIPSIRLEDFFNTHEQKLREYYSENRQNLNRKRLFYTIQNSRLQCLFGAYFTEFDQRLISMLEVDLTEALNQPQIYVTTRTADVLREIAQRVGQQQFSDNVKRNYNYKCCYPGCEVDDRSFLIGAHIARWADNEVLRGHVGNGLCLCTMHDKAFEKGLFTIDINNRIVLVRQNFPNKAWINSLLLAGEGQEIKMRQIDPLLDALEIHWNRVGHIEI